MPCSIRQSSRSLWGMALVPSPILTSVIAHIYLLAWWGWDMMIHDDVIKWKNFPRYWPFVREIHRSPVNSLHKGQWRGALIFSLICVWINGWVNNRETGDLRRHRADYDITVMKSWWVVALHFLFVEQPVCWMGGWDLAMKSKYVEILSIVTTMTSWYGMLPHHSPLWDESIDDQIIPMTKG